MWHSCVLACDQASRRNRTPSHSRRHAIPRPHAHRGRPFHVPSPRSLGQLHRPSRSGVMSATVAVTNQNMVSTTKARVVSPEVRPNPSLNRSTNGSHQARAGGTRYIFASPGLASAVGARLAQTLGTTLVPIEHAKNPARPRRNRSHFYGVCSADLAQSVACATHSPGSSGPIGRDEGH